MATWNDFIKAIKCYGKLYNDMNIPCSIEEISGMEKIMGCSFPEDLRNAYLCNNGQKGIEKGIFKAISGFDIYKRPKFLSLTELRSLWERLSNDAALQEYFYSTLIPFAADNKDFPDNVFCLDAESGKVFLLWALAPDFTLPADWQLSRIKQANSFSEFLDNQILFYGMA